MFKTPILFLIFNRPELTEITFQRIREVHPSHLFIAADGARKNKPGEEQLCQKARFITEQIDWTCEVQRLYRDENLGCGKAVSEAITWFFESVEEGIILEDDIFPDLSFFSFCEVLLERFRGDERVMEIGGTHLHGNRKFGNGSYYFSRYGGIWGWATWRSAWKKSQEIWTKFFLLSRERKIDTWDFQWVYAKLKNKGICIVPNINLINNLGFGSAATHTSKTVSKFQKLKLGSINEIIHPNDVAVSENADDRFMDYFQDQKAMVKKWRENYSGWKQRLGNAIGNGISKIFFDFKILENIQERQLNEKFQRLSLECNLANSAKLYQETKIYNQQGNPSKIEIYEGSHIRGELLIYKYGGEILIGRNCYVGINSKIWSGNQIRIGNEVLISHNVHIVDTNAHEMDFEERNYFFNESIKGNQKDKEGSIESAPIEIGDNVWINFNSIILKGISIGKGAVIGAGSVVTKNVPPFAVVGGNPAVVIKMLK
jgi:acetyltransferase-like isoleucine patch superfamily enzyme